VSCSGGKDGTDTGGGGDADTDADSDSDTDADTDTDTDTDVEPEPFNIEGTAIDLGSVLSTGAVPVADGLCVALIDPSPLITGGDAVTLSTIEIGAAGAFSFPDVVTDSVLGLLTTIDDCETATGDTVYSSSTGIPAPDGGFTGEDITGHTSFSIDANLLAGLAGSATAAGYATDLAADGFMFGFIQDATGAPVDGATVVCAAPACTVVFYMDAEPTDGLFTTGAAPNTAASAAAGSAFLVPAAGIGNWVADDGGGHTWPDQLNGSNPGSAVITALIAN
jgi:hypothetical protein